MMRVIAVIPPATLASAAHAQENSTVESLLKQGDDVVCEKLMMCFVAETQSAEITMQYCKPVR